jgi:hypothetical protein
MELNKLHTAPVRILSLPIRFLKMPPPVLQYDMLEFPFLNLVSGNDTNVLLLDYITASRQRGFYEDIGDMFYIGPQMGQD